MNDFTQTERLALYRLLVEQTNMIATTRRETSHFFLTFNTAAFGGIGFAMANPKQFPAYLLAGLAVGMVLVGLLWFSLIRYYGRIAGAKFKVICQLEDKFEIKPFTLENDAIWTNKNAVSGTTLESSIPILFAIGYIALATTILLQPAA
jgi:hypothetical protein